MNLNYPWLLISDFNEIASPSAKIGGKIANKKKMDNFVNFLNKAELIDIGYTDPKFT